MTERYNPERRSPTLRRRRLSTELRKLREATIVDGKALTGTAVERHFGWSPGKISRMERGDWTLPNLRDVRDLLDLYGVTDVAVREELLTWARDGRQKGWWSAYKDVIKEPYGNYIGLEAEAKSIACYQTSVVPGLLQTPAYAQALMTNTARALTPEEIEKRVEIRMNRQQLLRGEDSLELEAVVDEAVLRRVIGNEDVLQEQRVHLARMAEPEVTNVKIRIVPFAAARYAPFHGSFSIMEFPHPNDRQAVYLEMLTGELFMEEAEDVRLYELAFRHLVGSALNPSESLDMLRSLI